MDDDLSIRVLYFLLNDVDRVFSLIADGVVSPRSRWDDVVYGDLGQVQIRVNCYNLFQAVIKPFAIKDIAVIEERLQDLECRHSVSFGLVHLLMKSDHLRHQVGVHFLYLLTTMGLLLKQEKLAHQHNISFGRIYLLMKNDHLRRQVGVHFLYLLTMIGLLLKQGKLAHQLHVESTDDLLVLVPLLVLYFLTFAELSDHSFVSHISVLEGPHPLQHLK